ncbi:MAG: hypothetical protein KME20_08670 [Kaiparowitsia implicata GSE-PSE-MK54-09C]|jgi:uncharacterized membrane protein (DUF106 family)|nr:hypothetical protein [Kaiparowitsia implicata GSE-PSE-MK54-09C]
MTKTTSFSSGNSQTPAAGATDSLWQPSWWQWLISALSGTVEIEKQTARHEQRLRGLQKSNEELQKSNEESQKSNEESRIKHEQRLNELKRQNARLAELESKLNEILHS